jgi:hypothetical protein
MFKKYDFIKENKKCIEGYHSRGYAGKLVIGLSSTSLSVHADLEMLSI